MKLYMVFLIALTALIVTVGSIYAANRNAPLVMKQPCVAVCSDLCSTECSSGMGYGFGPKGLAIVKPTAVQVKKLQKIHADFVGSTKTYRARLQERMRELSSLWASGNGNRAKVNKIIDGIEFDRKIIRNAAVDSTFKAMIVLNARQREKLQSSVTNGYVHLLTIGTRMSGGANASLVKSKGISTCGTACKVTR